MLQDEEQKEYLEGVVEEAKGMVEKKVNYKKNSGNVAMYVLHMHEIICVYHQIPHCRWLQMSVEGTIYGVHIIISDTGGPTPSLPYSMSIWLLYM